MNAQTETCIQLQADLIKDVERVASEQHLSQDQIVSTALRRYIRQVEEQRIQEEIAAFQRMHAKLKEQYRGEVVAIHQGEVVDHDENFGALHQRIRERFGNTAVLLRRVSSEFERTLTFHSPRIKRG
jgi:ribosomal protein L19